MTMQEKAKLVKLSDTHLEVADPAEDVRGRKVVDRNGDQIGTVDDLLIDTAEKKVRFLQVGSGGFLGIGQKEVLIPVDAITRITDDAVRINQTREHVAGAPNYDPDLVDERTVNDAYTYWGYTPYWAPGYVYPAYPYYPIV